MTPYCGKREYMELHFHDSRNIDDSKGEDGWRRNAASFSRQ